ncbi:transglutaminase-like cysteine peptidase [Mesorhizobium delmotii]|uniref:transglutaminase-like cysteine peptidase n=1 Tax=Mesorhizobium delmotii TaxID=1631247 RepID=UPI001AD80EAF
MVIGRLTRQPIGHFEFCKRYPAECSVKPAEQALLPISRDLLGKLAAITAEVNRAVRPVRDADLYGKRCAPACRAVGARLGSRRWRHARSLDRGAVRGNAHMRRPRLHSLC